VIRSVEEINGDPCDGDAEHDQEADRQPERHNYRAKSIGLRAAVA